MTMATANARTGARAKLAQAMENMQDAIDELDANINLDNPDIMLMLEAKRLHTTATRLSGMHTHISALVSTLLFRIKGTGNDPPS
jgi:hypothetical protein